MPILDKKLIDFDKGDVRLMQEMLAKFYELHGGAETPDWASNYVAYLPVFAIALLISQQETERLSKRLELLTIVLVILTVLLLVLTGVLVFYALKGVG